MSCYYILHKIIEQARHNYCIIITYLLLLAGYSQNKMYMVVRDLFFRPDYKRFSFTLNTSCQNCLCARGNQIYHVQAMRPGSFTPAWAQVTNRTVNIPSSVYQDEDVVTDVYSIGANGFFCSNLTYVFRLESNGKLQLYIYIMKQLLIIFID